jgi:hypothetical protein
MTTEEKFVEAVRTALVEATACGIQESVVGKNWPCGTCTCDLIVKLLPESAPEYAEHNDPVDRVNELWRAILQMRDYQPITTPCQTSNPIAVEPSS